MLAFGCEMLQKLGLGRTKLDMPHYGLTRQQLYVLTRLVHGSITAFLRS